jgi:hypothetical protein
VEKKAAAISAAWAILSVSTDESMEKVIITPSIVARAMEWYREVLQENELDHTRHIEKDNVKFNRKK